MLWKSDKKIIKRKYLENWHPVFAWFPHIVEVDKKGHPVKAWLQRIERKGIYNNGLGIVNDWWDWEYRPTPTLESVMADANVLFDEYNEAQAKDNLPFFG